ncbi:VanZ family protein [Candidatus Woesebacteria bacterium]|nr:VanZ family protein [Candidatus Woesebacteria bacterium]
MKKKILYWLPPILWMSLIFTLSSRQRISVSDINSVNFIFFKSLHIIEYAILFFLVFRAVYKTTKLSLHQVFCISIGLAILYGASDELHQAFVPTREGSPRDIVIDSIGILLCFMYTKINLPKLKRLL